ncbi:hypothetical protein C0995_009708 [Termitomyces sp. Mi166|nr:hypothetical protein C0995_009708 [Termitomyces sp. Mi166\
MADKNIHEGDEGKFESILSGEVSYDRPYSPPVSWKWGTSEPSGTVAEVKTEGKLEIETKGKLVHKNADPSNPAVHVERTGNDVVKRASELTKLTSSADSDSAEPSAPGEKDGAGKESGEKEKQESVEKPVPKKRAPRKKSNASATTGEKREVDEGDGGAEAAAEEADDKRIKRAKTTKADAGGEKKRSARTRKGSKAKKAQDGVKHVEGEAMDVDAKVQSGEGTTVPKNKGPGRPKKSDASDHSPAVERAPVDEDTPAANIRSKD